MHVYKPETGIYAYLVGLMFGVDCIRRKQYKQVNVQYVRTKVYVVVG